MNVRLGLNQLKNQIQLAGTILDKGKINAATFTLKKLLNVPEFVLCYEFGNFALLFVRIFVVLLKISTFLAIYNLFSKLCG